MLFDPINRRLFLQGLGGFTLGLPMLASITPAPKAQAATNGAEAPLRRVVFLGLCHSSFRHHRLPSSDFQMTQVGPNCRMAPLPANLADYAAAFDVPELNELRSHMTVISGLRNARHSIYHAPSVALSGTLAEFNYGPSAAMTVDQVLARSGSVYMVPPAHRSLVLGWLMREESFSTTMNGQTPVANLPILDPAVAFARLFKAPSHEDAEATSRTNKSIIDLVLSDFKRLRASTRIAAEDRVRLENHIESLRGLEKRLAAISRTQCPAPEQTAYRSYWDYPEEANANFIEIIVAAMTCGITKVAMLSPMFGNLAVFDPTLEYHFQVHNRSPKDVASILNSQRYFFQQGALIAKRLQDVVEDEVTGDTFLDRTLICYVNEHGVCPLDIPDVHHGNDQQVVTLGGKHFMNTGKVFDFMEGPDRRPIGGKGRLNNEWLIAIMRGMGLSPREWEKDGVPGFGEYHDAVYGDPIAVTDRRSPLPHVTKLEA